MRTCHSILLTRTVGLTLCANQQTNTEKLSQQPKNKHRETVIQRSVKSVFHLDDITTHKLERTCHSIQQTTRSCDNIQWENAENMSAFSRQRDHVITFSGQTQRTCHNVQRTTRSCDNIHREKTENVSQRSADNDNV